jgi:hypothetical protein
MADGDPAAEGEIGMGPPDQGSPRSLRGIELYPKPVIEASCRWCMRA